MRVLIVEHHVGDVAGAEQQLHEAGHETVSCADPDGHLACRGLDPAVPCPLDAGVIDAALVVTDPSRGHDDVAPGYVCAHRRCIPTVAVGSGPAPANLSVTGWVPDLDTVVDALERCVAEPLPVHSRVAATAVRETLDRRGLHDVGASALVERRDGRLHIRIETSDPLPPAVGHATSVRALAAVRQVDPLAPAIGVTIEP
jgi:hypothetical protein